MAAVESGNNKHDAGGDDPSIWQEKEVDRLNALFDSQVLAELERIMDGYDYSWHTINQALQEQLDDGTLEFTLEHGDVIFEWNNLCEERQEWEKRGCFSVCNADFNRDCLINLKIIPVRAGLGNKVPQLVATNSDRPGLSTKDLGVEPTGWEDLSSYEKADDLTECGHWSPASDADESDYGYDEYGYDKYGDDEYGDDEYRDDEYEVEHYDSEVENDDAFPHTSWLEDYSDDEWHEKSDV